MPPTLARPLQEPSPADAPGLLGDAVSRRFACVVGAPRCGTTSLSRYLAEHPDVRFSRVKEPHFFSRYDLGGLGDEALSQALLGDYLPRFFGEAAGEGRLLAEGSVSYLYAAERMRPILRAWPGARFVICVRDPMAMLPSLHRRLLYQGDETVRDFAKAWALVAERAAGRQVPRSCIDPRLLHYDEIGRLGKHVGRFMEVVGPDRCFVVVHDDLAADPAGLYQRLVAFLGLEDDGREEFGTHRAGEGFKLGWLQRLLKRPPLVTRALMAGEVYRQRVKPLAAGKQDGALVRAVMAARKGLLRWNKAPAPPIRLDPALRRDIRDTLKDDVEALGRLLGRDLSHWLKA